MIVACWSAKGGAGTTVIAAALAVIAARADGPGSLLVDFAGDAPAVLGLGNEPRVGVHTWLSAVAHRSADELARMELQVDDRLSILPAGSDRSVNSRRVPALLSQLHADGRRVVIDCGTLHSLSEVAATVALDVANSLLVTRCCYLAMRRVKSLAVTPSGIITTVESGRALLSADIAHVVGAPVVAEVPIDPQIARLVDSGTLLSRLSRSLERPLSGLVDS